MTIQELIDFLSTLPDNKVIAVDVRLYDEEIYYDKDLQCVLSKDK